MSKRTQWIILGTALFLAAGMLFTTSVWKPWQRPPAIFYAAPFPSAPFILPMEVVKGDELYLPDGRVIIISQDERINQIWWDSEGVTTNATVLMTIWGWLTNR